MLCSGAGLGYVDPNTVQHVFNTLGPYLGWVVATLCLAIWPIRYLYYFLKPRILALPRWSMLTLALVLGVASSIALFSFFGKPAPLQTSAAWSGAAAPFARVLVLGMDGLDAGLMEKLMQEGALPHFSRLASQGGYKRLQTSTPPESPVAWSTIATGCDAGEHGIFDFLHRDRERYLPLLSLRKSGLNFGTTQYRKARQREGFWAYTSEAGVPTTVLRWPVAFPAEKVHGRFLSGLGVPDLLGGEGAYAYFTSAQIAQDDSNPNSVTRVTWDGVSAQTRIRGPATDPEGYVSLDLAIARAEPAAVKLTVQGSPSIVASLGTWSPWVSLPFKIGFRELRGQMKFMLTELDPHLRLYGSPIHMDPSAQAFPFTCPECYGAELAGKIGAFHTLGMPEQVRPLADKRYDFPAFLSECQAIERERRKMLELELNRFDVGVLAFVLDTSDRIQHTLWAASDPRHPMHTAMGSYAQVIPNKYREMDEVLGEVLAKTDARTAVLVLSDHGFNAYRRTANVNRWLIEKGYMNLRGGNNQEGRDLFQDVDWSRTQAYALGFCGVYLNLRGREGQGIVEETESRRLLEELSAKLCEWKDPASGEPVVHNVYLASEIYHGPATPEGPDLVVGLKSGFRASFHTALGGAPVALVDDNPTVCSGDHLVDPSFVPGVLFCNQKILLDEPRLVDIAPTVLHCLGLQVPAHMTGKPLF